MSREAIIAAFGSWLVRALIRTLRIELVDEAGITRDKHFPQVIYAFWHNRLFLVPHLSERWLPHRTGAALTSASKDGAMLAAFLGRFGIRAVRGSSSRRGAVALIEMLRLIRAGHDIAITPDGPRGPRYHLNPGVVVLAQKSGLPILPINTEFSHCWQLGRWDGFLLPKPFAKARLHLRPLYAVRSTANEEEFAAECERLRQHLLEATEKR